MSSNQSPPVPLTPTSSKSAPSYQTPTQSSISTKQSSNPPNKVRSHMEAHGMFIDNDLWDQPEMQTFRARVERVAEVSRPSGRKPQSEIKWQKRVKNLESYNEATMLDHILPMLRKDGRQVPDASGPLTLLDAPQHAAQNAPQNAPQNASHDPPDFHLEWEDFEDSGLDWTQDQQFKSTYLPNAYAGVDYSDDIAKALAKGSGVKNPKPDCAFGFNIKFIQPPSHQDALLRPQTWDLLNAIPSLHYVFFLIEAVQSAGDRAKATNQVCRDGTVAVRLQRLILEAIGKDVMKPGLDDQTYVYTATVTEGVMEFWVNFAYVHVDESNRPYTRYYMEHIYTNAFRAPDALLYLRRVCHNILDWGTRSRLQTVQQRSNDMYNFEKTAIAEDAAKSKQQSQAKEQSQGAGTKKKRKLEAGSVSESLC
ncbi:MAG: hypothetical protein LQ341_003728 [Variospora aurantia]|nr:MAG: hypothetical protein LQ341_003728 [Variospora aurantia]